MDEAPNLNNLCMWRQDDFGEISDNFCWYQNSGFNFNFFSLREGIGYNYLEWRSHIYGWLNKDFIQFCMYHPNISNFIHCYDFWGDIYGCFILFLILELFDLEIIGSKCFSSPTGYMLMCAVFLFKSTITIFVNLGLFRHFETVTTIRTWIILHRYWRML